MLTDLLSFQSAESMPLSCPQFLRYQFSINSEQALPLNRDHWMQQGYKYFKYIQKKGGMIITWPGVYYSGINTGWNLNEEVNPLSPSGGPTLGLFLLSSSIKNVIPSALEQPNQLSE